jgi:hypothetical protein
MLLLLQVPKGELGPNVVVAFRPRASAVEMDPTRREQQTHL